MQQNDCSSYKKVFNMNKYLFLLTLLWLLNNLSTCDSLFFSFMYLCYGVPTAHGHNDRECKNTAKPQLTLAGQEALWSPRHIFFMSRNTCTRKTQTIPFSRLWDSKETYCMFHKIFCIETSNYLWHDMLLFQFMYRLCSKCPYTLA